MHVQKVKGSIHPPFRTLSLSQRKAAPCQGGWEPGPWRLGRTQAGAGSSLTLSLLPPGGPSREPSKESAAVPSMVLTSLPKNSHICSPQNTPLSLTLDGRSEGPHHGRPSTSSPPCLSIVHCYCASAQSSSEWFFVFF